MTSARSKIPAMSRSSKGAALSRRLLRGRVPVAGKLGTAISIQSNGGPLPAGRSDPYRLRDALRRYLENFELTMSCRLRAVTQRTFRESGTDFTGCHQLPEEHQSRIYRQRFHRFFHLFPRGRTRVKRGEYPRLWQALAWR